MKKIFFATLALAALGLLNGCNGIGNKDTLLARINGEKVFQEDYSLLLKDGNNTKLFKNEYLYKNLYGKAALVSRALDEFPELEAEWESYFKEIEPRILMMMFQRFYAMERLTFSDAELLRYYEANRGLFPEDSTGDYNMVRSDVASYYYATKNPEEFSKYMATLPKKEGMTQKDSLVLMKKFADGYRMKLRDALSKDVLEQGHISIESVPAVEPRDFYENHKDLFMTVPGYVLYHVQGDSSSLAGLLADSVSLEQFKQVAAAKSKSGTAAKDSGLVGRVKKGYALPAGIGMVNGLDSILEGRDAGFVTPVLSSKESFHRFYVASVVASEQKPYDRVEPSIKAKIKSGDYFEIDSSAVLIYKDGKPVFTERDLLDFFHTYYKRDLTLPIHERLVSMFAETFAYAELAKEKRLDHTWEYRAMVRSTRLDYLGNLYIDKKLGMDEFSEDSLKALYDRVGSPIHVGYSYEKAKDDLKRVLAFPKNLYDHEYLFGYRMIYVDKTYDQSVPAIYSRRSKEWLEIFRERLMSEAYLNSSVHLYDTSIPEYKPRVTDSLLLARADSLVQAGDRTYAYYAYRLLMYAYADVDSLFEKAAYEMAQLQGDNEEFLDAEAEYYAFYRMWPNSRNAEKAMFSRAFILNENLRMNDKAQEVLEEFLKTYPKSEMKESAEWLLNNIKSGGKLAEDLMKKIEAEE